MSSRVFVFFVALAVFGMSCSAVESSNIASPNENPQTKNPLFDLDGLWQGNIEGFHGPGLTEARVWDHELKINIAGDSAEVAFRWEGEWRNHGTFEVSRHRSNAVLHRTHSGDDDDCSWVETWSFTVMQASVDSLRVHWYRLVNNWQCDDEKQRDGAFASSGVLKRAAKE